jgi:uncharacterized protein
MLWKGRRGSGNVEDRRGMGGPIAIGGGIVGVIALILNLLLGGGDSGTLQEQLQDSGPRTEQEAQADDELAAFTSVVLADNEDVWNKIFAENGSEYVEPKLVLYRQGTQSGCGMADKAVGPFYCPADNKIYLDLSFFEELQTRFGAAGDFAMAYVISHEVGHHVQFLMGTSQKMDRLRQQVSKREYNKYSVMLELQADFYAGVWAHHAQKTKQILEPGDIEEALQAANAIGDDRLQMEAQGKIVPDAFTHGTSEQRVYWFKKGFETGDIRQGDTFRELSEYLDKHPELIEAAMN